MPLHGTVPWLLRDLSHLALLESVTVELLKESSRVIGFPLTTREGVALSKPCSILSESVIPSGSTTGAFEVRDVFLSVQKISFIFNQTYVTGKVKML